MCVIVVKPAKEKLPSRDTLLCCFNNNRHGAGFMFVRESEVIIRKGFMEFDAFWKSYKSFKLTKNDVIVYHFRIASIGPINKHTCHPFPITNNTSQLKSCEVSCRYGVCHNGTIRINVENELSDTMQFTKDVLADSKVCDNLESTGIQSLIDMAIGSGKIAILSHDRKLYLFGDWINDNGILFSNSSYRNITRGYEIDSSVWNFKDGDGDDNNDSEQREDEEEIICVSCESTNVILELDGSYSCIDCGQEFTHDDASIDVEYVDDSNKPTCPDCKDNKHTLYLGERRYMCDKCLSLYNDKGGKL